MAEQRELWDIVSDWYQLVYVMLSVQLRFFLFYIQRHSLSMNGNRTLHFWIWPVQYESTFWNKIIKQNLSCLIPRPWQSDIGTFGIGKTQGVNFIQNTLGQAIYLIFRNELMQEINSFKSISL